MVTHSSILAWEIPWTEEPGGLQSMGLQRVGHDLVTKQQLFFITEKKKSLHGTCSGIIFNEVNIFKFLF